MNQFLFNIFAAIYLSFSLIFSLPVTQVPEKAALPMERQPDASEYQCFDKVEGVDNSVFYIARPKAEALQTIHAADFGMNPDLQDNFAAFSSAIDYCRNNPNTRLVVDKGTYYFRSPQSIDLTALNNIMIDAKGATFIFNHDRYFIIQGCSGLEIRGLAVDWDWNASRLASLVKVEHADRNTNTADLVFTELDSLPDSIPLCALTQFDAEALTPGSLWGTGFNETYIYQKPDMIVGTEQTGKNVLRITHDGTLDYLADGQVYLLRHYVYGSAVFNIQNSQNVTFDGINIYSAAGMGFVCGNLSQRFQILNTCIGLKPGFEKERRISVTADAIHIADTKGYFRVSGCDFSFMGDDALNVHDNLGYAAEKAADNALLFSNNAHIFSAGDTVEFFDGEYAPLDFTAKVIDNSAGIISFDRKLPANIGANCIICNKSSDSGNYVISNNYFHEQRARGLLLQSDNGLCESNRFYKTMGEAIKIVMDINVGYWYEGKGVNNIVIRNNTFEKCDYSGWGSVINLSTNIDGKNASRTMFSNITITENTFINMTRYLLNIEDHVAGLTFTRNNIINHEKHCGRNKLRGKIFIGEDCGAIEIKDNCWKPSVYAPCAPFIKLKDFSSMSAVK